MEPPIGATEIVLFRPANPTARLVEVLITKVITGPGIRLPTKMNGAAEALGAKILINAPIENQKK